MPSPRTPTILVVEDDPAVVSLLEYLLGSAGFAVRTARDGQEALRLIEADDPVTLVLMDVMLPYRSGLDVLRHLRRDPRWRHVPVVMLTGNAQTSDVTAAFGEGADDHITKPFAPAELLVRIRRRIQQPVPA